MRSRARWRARFSAASQTGCRAGRNKKSCGRDGGLGQAVVLKLKRGRCTKYAFFSRLVWCQVHLLDQALESSSFGPLRWCEPQRLWAWLARRLGASKLLHKAVWDWVNCEMDPGASVWAVPNPISLARLGTGHLPSVSSKPKQASRPRGRRRKTFNIKIEEGRNPLWTWGLDSTSNLDHISTPSTWLAEQITSPLSTQSPILMSSSMEVCLSRLFEVFGGKRGQH